MVIVTTPDPLIQEHRRALHRATNQFLVAVTAWTMITLAVAYLLRANGFYGVFFIGAFALSYWNMRRLRYMATTFARHNSENPAGTH